MVESGRSTKSYSEAESEQKADVTYIRLRIAERNGMTEAGCVSGIIDTSAWNVCRSPR